MSNVIRNFAILAIPTFFAATQTAFPDVTLPSLFSSHMVLQRSASTPVWGRARPGEKVTLTFTTAPGFGQKTVVVTTSANGKWLARLDLTDAPATPFELRVQSADVGVKPFVIEDVVAGEVWLASGQSNMEFKLAGEMHAKEELPAADNPLVRYFHVHGSPGLEPRDEVRGKWIAATPKNSADFSAVAWYFAKRLNAELGVPVGILNASWGGTPSEAWTSIEALATVPALKRAMENQRSTAINFPAARDAFAEDFERWLRESNRAEPPAPLLASPAHFANDSAADSDAVWAPVRFPQKTSGKTALAGFGGNGAIWLRTKVSLAKVAPRGVKIDLPQSGGWPSIYWNGRHIVTLTHRDIPKTGVSRTWHIPKEHVKTGEPNTLAIRLFAPACPLEFSSQPLINSHPARSPWEATIEFEMPPATPAQLASAPVPPRNPAQSRHIAGNLFNGMIRPLIPFGIRGVIWYQGEDNASRAIEYRDAFPLLINDWRSRWAQDGFSFYWCQLANFMAKKTDPAAPSSWALLREAQTRARALPNTGQAVLIDLGAPDDIHPANKRDVGERLARIALARDYGKAIAFSGPVFKSMSRSGAKLLLTLDTGDGGALVARPLAATHNVRDVSPGTRTAPLVRNSPGGELEGFVICGADRKWVWANAGIKGSDTVILWSDNVAEPVAARYAWADNPTCNLYNAAGLPAVPFRTDED
ncbi:protein of unknown function (DUF303) [Opitutaceae bacterium TAV1]|nr:protein of unknown function (DUF303) [Opitutaceae bacterium TAV1]